MRHLDQLEHIFLTAYAHPDHAWTNSRQWHIKRYVEGMRQVLDLMQKDPEFTYVIDTVHHYFAVLERFMPERMEELHQRVREGRMCVANGGMTLPYPNNFGDELYVRNAVAGQRYFREKLPEADQFMFFNADCAMGHTQLPQLLTQMGHTHYRFYRPESALDRLGVPREFIWRGLDGSEIVATRGMYASFMAGACCDGSLTDWEDRKQAFLEEDILSKLPYMETEQVYLNVGGDDTYPQFNRRDIPIDVIGFVEEWNSHETVRLGFASPADYHKALTAKPLPVWEGVCDPVDLNFNGPNRSKESLNILRLQAEQLLLYAERLEVLLLQLGGETDGELLKNLWDLSFTFCGHAMQFLMKREYEEMLERAYLVLTSGKQYVRELLLRIAAQAGSAEPDSYLLINPCLFERQETVTLLITTPQHIFGLRLLDETGAEVPYQILDTYDGDKFYANNDHSELEVAVTLTLPPLGYRRIHAVRGSESIRPKAERECFVVSDYLPAQQPVVLDNDRFRFTVQNGQVTDIMDCRTGLRRLPEGSPFGQLRFYATEPTTDLFYEWDRKEMQCFKGEKVRWTQRGPERWQLTTFGTIDGLPAEIQITTERESPTLTYEIVLEKRTHEGYYSMAFPCTDPEYIVAGIPYGAEPRNVREILYGEDMKDDFQEAYLVYERGCTGSYCAMRYTHVPMLDGRLLLTQGETSYIYRCNREEGEVETMLLRSQDHCLRERIWLRRMHSADQRFSVHSFSFTASVVDTEDQAQAERLVSRVRFPVCTTPVYELTPKAPAARNSAVAGLPENLTAAAFYPDGDHLVLRLFENSGLGWKGRLTLIPGLRQAQSCDLMEDHPTDLPVTDGAVEITVRPWEIVTLRLYKE